LPVIVALNRFGSDTEREFEMIRIGKVAKKIYHASEVVADTAACKKIEKLQEAASAICRAASRQYDFAFASGAPRAQVQEFAALAQGLLKSPTTTAHLAHGPRGVRCRI